MVLAVGFAGVSFVVDVLVMVHIAGQDLSRLEISVAGEPVICVSQVLLLALRIVAICDWVVAIGGHFA